MTDRMDAGLARLADNLWAANATREPVPQPSSASDLSLTVDDAYFVQSLNIAKRVARGERIIGRKVGLTSLAMQRQLGVDQPDFGVITDVMVTPNGGEVDPAAFIAPKLEAEFAFRIGTALPPNPSLEELRAAITDVAVAIELIDSRIVDWRISLVDTIADNASSAGIIVGPWRRATAELLASIIDTEIALTCDGKVVAAGPGSAVLGDPVVALQWLAMAIGTYGQAFQPGEVVLAGAVAASVPLARGREWAARAAGFEPVVVRSAPRHTR